MGAARGGAALAALGGLAQEIYERCCRDGTASPPDDGLADRWFRLGITFRGAGRAEGDLTPGCAAALSAVLEALGKKAGPEDTRTSWQRRHDALEEACRRLIAGRDGAGPGRAAHPGAGASDPGTVARPARCVRRRGGLGRRPRASQPGWLTGPEADAALCDATVVPVVTGHVDWAALDELADVFLLAHGPGRRAAPASPAAVPATNRVPDPSAPPPATGSAAPCSASPPMPSPAPADWPHGCAPPSTAGRSPPPQPAAGHRRRHRNHPRPPAPGGDHPPFVLRVPRLRPARHRLRHPPPHPPIPRRPHQPAQPRAPLQLPPPHRHPPMGLDPHPAPRRHHHRHQPQPHPHPPQPQPAWPRPAQSCGVGAAPQSSSCRVSASFGQGVAAWPAEERAGGRAVRCHRAGDALQEVLREPDGLGVGSLAQAVPSRACWAAVGSVAAERLFQPPRAAG